MWVDIKELEQVNIWWKAWSVYGDLSYLHEAEREEQDIQVQAGGWQGGEEELEYGDDIQA